MTRHLVVCTDGTWNRPDQRDRGRIVPSNVVKAARAVAGRTEDNIPQLIYYDPGVGTGGSWDRIKGGAFGIGLSDNVTQAYAAIGRTFRPGDKLFLFGFSRGAYTARSLAGLIGLCGIPDPKKGDVADTVRRAFSIYRMDPASQGEQRSEKANGHAEKRSHSYGQTILNSVHFIGVWDTVGALGVPVWPLKWIGRGKHKFHDTTLGSHITYACHAVAIDERRRPFAPTLWLDTNLTSDQKVVQAWFSGVHTNIGGGYLDSGLSDRAFLWMCLHARDAGLGFDEGYMSRRIDPNYHGELRDSLKPRYRVLIPMTRVIGETLNDPAGNPCAAAGECIHYSAQRRFDHETETLYREGHARNNLGRALAAKQPPVCDPFPEEEDFHSGVSGNWNDGGGSPASFS